MACGQCEGCQCVKPSPFNSLFGKISQVAKQAKKEGETEFTIGPFTSGAYGLMVWIGKEDADD